MQSSFFRAICQMGIFMICAQSIVHFRPKASYEKYLKMLVGIMILIQLFLPVCRLVSGIGAEAFEARVRQFEEGLSVSMKQAGEHALYSERKLEQMTLEEVQTRLREQEEQSAVSEEQAAPIKVEQVEVITIEAGAEE